VTEGFRCDASVPILTDSFVFISISEMIKSGEVARYSMCFQISFEKNRELKANYVHHFVITWWCFYSMFMRSMRIISDLVSYYMIYTIKYKDLNKNTQMEKINNKQEKVKQRLFYRDGLC